MLGVRLDLGSCREGIVKVSNKPGRIDEILQTWTTVLEQRKLRPSDLPSPLGRLQYADMQIAGRSGRLRCMIYVGRAPPATRLST